MNYKQCSYECPNCGQVFDFNTCKLIQFTIPKHQTTVPTVAHCPGSGQSGITIYQTDAKPKKGGNHRV